MEERSIGVGFADFDQNIGCFRPLNLAFQEWLDEEK